MNALTEIGIFVLQTLGGLYVLLVLLRFLLQVIRADIYNPICQFIVKATNTFIIPLRKVVPSIAGYDTSSLLVALVVQAITIFLSGLVTGSVVDPLSLLLWSLIGLASLVVIVFYIAMIIIIIISFLVLFNVVSPANNHPIILLIRQLTNPLCAPFQRLFPPSSGFDLSPIFVFMILHIVRILLAHAAAATNLNFMLVPGI